MSRNVISKKSLIIMKKRYESRINHLSAYIKMHCDLSAAAELSTDKWRVLTAREAEMHTLISVVCDLKHLIEGDVK